MDTSRRTKNLEQSNPYQNLATDVVINAIHVVTGEVSASQEEIDEAKEFLKSDKADRWAGLNLTGLFKRENSTVNLEEK